MHTTGGVAQRRNLVNNLRSELDFLMPILGDDPVIRAFSQQVTAYSDLSDEQLDEPIWQNCVDVQMALHDYADTVVSIHQIGYERRFLGTTMFSKLWHFTTPHTSTPNGWVASVPKSLIATEVCADLATTLDNSTYELNFTVVKRCPMSLSV